MAFVFDATPMSPTANSYVAVEFADDYFTAHLQHSKWDTLSTLDKQRALVMATQRLDVEWYMGLTTTQTQHLIWPRRVVISRDMNHVGSGFILDPYTIPKYLQWATCEQALVYIDIMNSEYMVEDNDLETLTSYKIGPMDIKIKPGLKADRIHGKVATFLEAIGPNVWRKTIGQQISL